MKTVNLYDGTQIPAIGLGTWMIGGGTRPDHSQDEKALRVLRAALEMGYTHIDTAEMYGGGHSEELVGQAIKGFEREKLFLATKVKPPNLRYKSVLRALDGSLKRLGVDYVDLYLVHWLSGSEKLEETFRALNQVVREGKVRYLGVSNFRLPELKESQKLSETPIVTNQVPYSLVHRRYVDNGVIPYCQENQIVVTAYSPVEKGRLISTQVLDEIARKRQVTPYQAALAWLVNQPMVITIPMSQDPEHLRQNLEAGDIELTDEEMRELNQIGR
jgi:diketogulonate reductase-like aldo/keto reductase